MNYRALLLAFSILTAVLSFSAVSAAVPVVAELTDQTALEGSALGGVNGLPVVVSGGVAPLAYVVDDVNVDQAKPKLQVGAQNAQGACPAGQAGICIDKNTGKISYTGRHSEIGTYTVTVTVTDANGDSDTEDFRLTVANSDPDLNLAKLSKDVVVLSTTNTVAVSSNSANNAIVLTANTQHQDKIAERNANEPIDAGLPSGDSLKYSSSTEWTTFTMKDDGTISFTPTDADVGYHYVTLTATDSSGATNSKAVRYFVKDSSDNEKLLVRNIDVTDVSGDEDEHEPGDDFEATLDVANLHNKDLESVKVKAWVSGVKDSTVKRYSERVQEDKFDLSAADTKDEITLKFRLSTGARKSTTDLTTYLALNIVAEGSDENGTLFTDYYVKEFKVTRQDHKIIFDSIAFNPPEATCGGSTEIAVKTINIGNSEEDVTVNVKNNALGTSLSTGQFTLKKEGSDAEKVSRLAISVPATAKAQDYTLDVTSSYNDGKTEQTEPVKLTVGCSAQAVASGTGTTSESAVAAIAVQQASAVAERGQAVKYTITVTNTQATAATFRVDVSGTQDWATASAEPSELTLAPGASSQLFVYLTPRRDASAGDHSATVSVVSGTTVLSSKVLTTLVKAGTTTVEQFSPATGASALKLSGNTVTIGFGALVILVAILAIVLVVTRNGKGNGKKIEKY
ncbi:MAG: putative S-layer protein [DPANN group archaeon]|nr:putative S-layer protein [DPANN group archaeon]